MVAVGFPLVGHAQFLSNPGRGIKGDEASTFSNLSKDSSKKQIKTNDSILIYWFSFSDSSRKKLDSSIDHLHRSPLMTVFETDLGNLGSSAQRVDFQPDMRAGNRLGPVAFSSLLYTCDRAVFYNTTKPYTDLYYRIGTKQEQIIELTHSRNVNPRWNLSAAYRKSGAPGSYKLQRTNHDNLMIGSHYASTNQRYSNAAVIVYNKLQQDENGGVVSEEYLNARNYNDKRLVPVVLDPNPAEKNRSFMMNYYRELSVRMDQSYFIGRSDSIPNADSSELAYRFTPRFGIRHSLYANSSYQRFSDFTPDSSFYASLVQTSFLNNDSVYGQYRWARLGNTFALAGNLQIRQQVVEGEAGYGVELETVKNKPLDQTYLNNFLFASLRKNESSSSHWLYDGQFRFYLSGNLLGNLFFNANAGRRLGKKAGVISAGYQQAIQRASYMMASYQTNYYSISADLKNQLMSRIHLTYTNEPYRTAISLRYYVLGNFIYRDTSLQVKQYGKVIPLMQLSVYNAWHIQYWVLESNLMLQQVDEQSPIHLPLLAAVIRLSHERPVLKNKLKVATGPEIRYRTPYLTDDYSPLVNSFVSQYTRRITNIPRMAYFFNFRVKTFRASICFDEIQQLFTRNNINYSGYPAQNFMMRFGFHWMFVN